MSNPVLLMFVSDSAPGAIEVFATTVEVMLEDGVLTREEKRLIIKLANALELSPSAPAEVYAAIRDGSQMEKGDVVEKEKMVIIYTQVYEVALVNASLSKDEFRVLAHLRAIFSIGDDEHERIENELQERLKDRFKDANVVDKMLLTLKDSVSLVGSLFDSVRTKSA